MPQLSLVTENCTEATTCTQSASASRQDAGGSPEQQWNVWIKVTTTAGLQVWSEDPRVHKHPPPHDTSGGSRPSSFFSRDDTLQQPPGGRRAEPGTAAPPRGRAPAGHGQALPPLPAAAPAAPRGPRCRGVGTRSGPVSRPAQGPRHLFRLGDHPAEFGCAGGAQLKGAQSVGKRRPGTWRGTEGPHLPDRAAQAASPPGQRARPCCPRGSGAGRPPITRHRHRPGPPSLQPPLQPLLQPVPPRAPHGASERLEQRALSQASSRVGAPATPRDGPDGRRRTARSPTSALSLRASPPAPRGSSLSERAPRAPSRRLRLPAPRRRPGRAETQLLRKDGYSVKIHPFPRELRKDLKFLPPPSQLRFFWLRRGLLSLEVFTMIFKWSVILSSSGSVDSVVMSPCYLKTGFASWWVSSQRTQPSQDQEKKGFTITCSKEKVTV
ncbi:uncharacterized protein AAG666_016431 [Megaptera novaeangliae]